MSTAREKLENVGGRGTDLALDAQPMADLLLSILDYIDDVEKMNPRFPDGRPDGIVIGLQVGATDLRQRFDLFAAGQPIEIPPVTS